MAEERRQTSKGRQNGKKKATTSNKPKKNAATEDEISIGKVISKLVERGWRYKPGRLEYDYFKPNVDISTAIVGEDYFETEAELEKHLKTSGLWGDILQELRGEPTTTPEHAMHGEDLSEDSSEEEEAKPAKKPRVTILVGKEAKPTAKNGTSAKAKAGDVLTTKETTVQTKKKVTRAESEPPLNFHIPQFKCSIGQVYGKLKKRGWYYKAVESEYHYYSPDYTKKTAILGGNYFQSLEELERFLRNSDLWTEIESELRDEHDEMVEELRQEAMQKATNKPATQTVSVPQVKVTIGKVVDKLVKRGWHYKPGRLEYDYFKPNVDVKTATVGEDYFETEVELEKYLKVSGLWNEISQELQTDFTAAQGRVRTQVV